MKRNSSPANKDQKNCCGAESVTSGKPVVKLGKKAELGKNKGKPVNRRFKA